MHVITPCATGPRNRRLFRGSVPPLQRLFLGTCISPGTVLVFTWRLLVWITTIPYCWLMVRPFLWRKRSTWIGGWTQGPDRSVLHCTLFRPRYIPLPAHRRSHGRTFAA